LKGLDYNLVTNSIVHDFLHHQKQIKRSNM
jgi:hypothetical protein